MGSVCPKNPSQRQQNHEHVDHALPWAFRPARELRTLATGLVSRIIVCARDCTWHRFCVLIAHRGSQHAQPPQACGVSVMGGALFLSSCGLLTLLVPTALPANQSPSPQEGAVVPAVVAGGLARQRPNLPPRGSSRNHWRYSFHNGHWWYYLDHGRWAYWTGSQWVDFEPKSYHRWHVRQKMADYDAELARFDSRLMRPYLSQSFTNGSPVWGLLGYALPAMPYRTASPSQGSGGAGGQLFSPRAFDGRLNPATSVGGYMGGALRGPFGD
jgi:hypothetical protein